MKAVIADWGQAYSKYMILLLKHEAKPNIMLGLNMGHPWIVNIIEIEGRASGAN
jgi:hypothetical protein